MIRLNPCSGMSCGCVWMHGWMDGCNSWVLHLYRILQCCGSGGWQGVGGIYTKHSVIHIMIVILFLHIANITYTAKNGVQRKSHLNNECRRPWLALKTQNTNITITCKKYDN